MTDVNAELMERLQAKDAMLFGLSDTLDVKSSIALVVITFLATQSAGFLTIPNLAEQLKVIQIMSAFALAGAGGFAVAALWPREHQTETAEDLDGWLVDLRVFYKNASDPESAVWSAFREGRIQRLKERIRANAEIDRVKSQFVMWSYILTTVALALNLGTLLGLSMS